MISGNKDELPNPHKECVRKLMATLICHDNDLRRVNVDLRNMQKSFHSEMEKLQLRCGEIPIKPCPNEDEVQDFTKRVSMLNDMNECYTQRIEELKVNREAIITNAKMCLTQLAGEKIKMKQFHERTLDYLKRYAINSDDAAVIQNCERDVCQMQHLFVKEVDYIKKCETALVPFFQQIEGPATEYFSKCCFQDFNWTPTGKSTTSVDGIAIKIRDHMGPSLIKAFAQAHLLNVTDMKSFFATYFLNCEKNEQILKQKLHLFGNMPNTTN